MTARYKKIKEQSTKKKIDWSKVQPRTTIGVYGISENGRLTYRGAWFCKYENGIIYYYTYFNDLYKKYISAVKDHEIALVEVFW